MLMLNDKNRKNS